MKTPSNIPSYQKHYSESGLWNKITSMGKKAGSSVIYKALQLYYAATDSATPTSHKMLIYGALGYLILPVDLIPDAIIGIGLTDDAAALKMAYDTCADNITPTVNRKAKNRLKTWFSEAEIAKL